MSDVWVRISPPFLLMNVLYFVQGTEKSTANVMPVFRVFRWEDDNFLAIARQSGQIRRLRLRFSVLCPCPADWTSSKVQFWPSDKGQSGSASILRLCNTRRWVIAKLVNSTVGWQSSLHVSISLLPRLSAWLVCTRQKHEISSLKLNVSLHAWWLLYDSVCS